MVLELLSSVDVFEDGAVDGFQYGLFVLFDLLFLPLLMWISHVFQSLQNLLKYYRGEQEGRDVLEAALHGMVDMARHINEMKREHEHSMKLQEIQSNLYNMEHTSLAEMGKLVMEVCRFPE